MNTRETDKQSVLVIGGGVGGIRAALDLAESRRDVVLIDKSYAIGGLMTRLDRTFPTNNCDLCTISPHLSESGRQLRLDLKPMTVVEQVEGQAGDFKVTIRTLPRYIDVEKCTACGECAEKFPDWVRFTPGLDPRAPTCMRYPQATPYAFSVDADKVTDFDALQKTCKVGAIIPDDQEKTETLSVASIILSTGAELFDPAVLDNFGGGQFPNVVTGLEYERLMSASGPTLGQLARPSDNKRPARVAWIQCVGSRGINRQDVPYCSSVCCMYALKEAIVTKERFAEDIEASIFYMDMRTCGKDYELYLNRAVNEYGVKLVRSRPHSVVEDSETGNLVITYATDDDERHKTEVFDMVVLSTGFRIPASTRELAGRLGIDLNEHGYAQTSGFSPVATSRPGIYVCGVSESPKDIPETMIQASAAAAMAGTQMHLEQDTGAEEEDFPPEIDVSGQNPRVGVFVCDCGPNIGDVITVSALVEKVRSFPGVAYAEAVGYGCSKESMDKMETLIREHGLNRVVIGGCSPRTHETKFQDMMRRCGLNKYLVEIVNIRDQDTWVHMDRPADATRKAVKMLEMGVHAVARAHPLMEHSLPMNQNVLVVGGGVTGMNAALILSDQGFRVYLVEREARLGGIARNIRATLEGDDVGRYITELAGKVTADQKIQVLTQSIIVDHKGMPGRFTTGIQTGPRMHYMQIEHGVSILATGALANRPGQYQLGEDDRVMTQLDMDAKIADDPESVRSMDQAVMIQCVGSREPGNPNCSRICCQSAIKNALRMKALNPDMQIYVLYRDMRTYGFQEDYYREARKQGVKFIRYEPESRPEVRADKAGLAVCVYDEVLGRYLEISADALVLSTGLIADDETTEDLSVMFHLPRSDDGYFLEDHVKLRPTDMSVRGFFVAGTAHAPKSIRESITQAQAAAGRAQTLLSKQWINLGASVAKVDGDKCAACLICVRVCPYNVPYINAEGYSEIDPARCHGCGTCVADCPARAIQLMQYEDDQILAKLDGLFERMN
ncbi:heterodisulfide reductase subunit A [Desulfosalsimonas propionicica]|uniref:Heterodisulfide reductase subunit A n=1 Tax=Desulfosalsimonas propionicica TaxID=332175 RepID=A0A7W0HJ46_9BACT|nr:FAD-dependent oxidoreductase [Desulfosalsimonas propionicica]MBA2879799.1 heterodisulfide reductase subunit A [Desulfosalsimonas propionicica]